MSSSADLFVVCRQCGSEVSPYITECPYCGHRLRRRAPKLPRESALGRSPRGLLARRLRRGGSRRRSSLTTRSRRFPRFGIESRVTTAPYVTIAAVALSCAAWVIWRPGFVGLDKLVIVGPLRGDWWKLFSTQFTYENGLYEFIALFCIALFGWLLERRHGPAVVLALFLGAGVGGALAALAAYPEPVVIGGNAAALGLLAAWAVPDLAAARADNYYEGDLLGTGFLATLLLAVPFALPKAEASWLAGVTGGALGLLVGLGLHRAEPDL
jgi:membrane associated rhomboid family serine protease